MPPSKIILRLLPLKALRKFSFIINSRISSKSFKLLTFCPLLTSYGPLNFLEVFHYIYLSFKTNSKKQKTVIFYAFVINSKISSVSFELWPHGFPCSHFTLWSYDLKQWFSNCPLVHTSLQEICFEMYETFLAHQIHFWMHLKS